MKKRIKAFGQGMNLFVPGMLALVLALGVLLAGCDTGTGSSADDTADDSPKELVITGISGVSANVIVVMLKPDLTNDSDFAAAGANTNGETVTIQLRNLSEQGGLSNTEWTGTGSYHVLLWESSDGNWSGNPNYITLEKVNFSSGTTTVAWSKFQAYTQP